MQQSTAALAVASMKSQVEDPEGKDGTESQSPDPRHQASSLGLVQGVGCWDHMGTALKSKEDEGTSRSYVQHPPKVHK